jgi:hypothetical protein
MRHITNPEQIPLPDDYLMDSRLYRTYMRLRSQPTGNVNAHIFRKLLGISGAQEHTRIRDILTELEKRGAITFDWFKNERGQMSYRLTLNILPDPAGQLDALNDVNVLTDSTRVMNQFKDLQEKVLGARKLPTIKDWATCKRLLNDVSLEVALNLVKAYWRLRAARRQGNNFNDFYFQYPSLLNDVVDERQVEAGQAARDARRTAPKEPRRDFLIREIALRTKRNMPLMGFDKELAELNGED